MTYNKRKKKSRQRGSWTHGWGEKKKHRGAGNRGGRGNAGSGKRSRHKTPSFLAEGKRLGKSGFINHNAKPVVASINVSFFDAVKLDGRKGVEMKKGVAVIDMAAMGYDKLLGSGSVKGKYEITVRFATASAVKKIQAAGGKVTVLEAPVETSSESEE